MLKCVDEVRKKDAEKVYCYVTHPVLAGDSVKKINSSSINEFICTNTLALREKSQKIVQLSVAGLISRQIKEIYQAN